MAENQTVLRVLLKLLSIAWWSGLLVFILAVIVSLVGLANIGYYSETVDVQFILDDSDFEIVPLSADISEAELIGLEGSLSFRKVFPLAEKIDFLIIILVPLSVFLLVIHRLRAVVRSLLMEGKVSAWTILNVRIIAWVIIAVELLDWLPFGVIFGGTTVADDFRFDGVLSLAPEGFYPQNYVWNFDVGGLFAGLILLAVAEIMNYAYDLEQERNTLREEQSLTV